MGFQVGIDLGTTNTVVAVMDGKTPRIVANGRNESLTPSIVSINERGDILVGEDAYDRAAADPENTVISVKRLIGRQFDDENVQRMRDAYEYSIERNPRESDIVIPLRQKPYTPTEITAEILKRVKLEAENRLKGPVTHAVITVPAYFDAVQKEQTRIAGELAGLRVKKIIVEPTAAAIAHDLQTDSDIPQTFLVYDLGGGTFDVSCLTAGLDMYAEIEKEGDMWLGGDDLDQALIQYCVEEIRRAHGVDPRLHRAFMFRLRRATEKAKRRLSTEDAVVITTPPLRYESRSIDISIPITVSLFESLIREKLGRTLDLTEKALKDADLTPDLIHTVLLVGGSTKVPAVRKLLGERFGYDKVSTQVDPMICVALGAAKLARDLAGITCPNEDCEEGYGHLNPLTAKVCEKCGFPLLPVISCPYCSTENAVGNTNCQGCHKLLPSSVLREKTSTAYGIELDGRRYGIIMPKGSEYPSYEPHVRQFLTASAIQRIINIRIYKGEDTENLEGNQFVGAGKILLDESVPSDAPVDVSFSLNWDETLVCEAFLRYGNAKPVRFAIDPRGGVQELVSENDEESDEPAWLSRVEFWDDVTSILLDRFRHCLSHSDLSQMTKLGLKLEEAQRLHVEKDGVEAADEASSWFGNHRELRLLVLGEMYTRFSNVDSGVQNRLGRLVGEISAFGERGDIKNAGTLITELDLAIDQAYESMEERGPIPEGLIEEGILKPKS